MFDYSKKRNKYLICSSLLGFNLRTYKRWQHCPLLAGRDRRRAFPQGLEEGCRETHWIWWDYASSDQYRSETNQYVLLNPVYLQVISVTTLFVLIQASEPQISSGRSTWTTPQILRWQQWIVTKPWRWSLNMTTRSARRREHWFRFLFNRKNKSCRWIVFLLENSYFVSALSVPCSTPPSAGSGVSASTTWVWTAARSCQSSTRAVRRTHSSTSLLNQVSLFIFSSL